MILASLADYAGVVLSSSANRPGHGVMLKIHPRRKFAAEKGCSMASGSLKRSTEMEASDASIDSDAAR